MRRMRQIRNNRVTPRGNDYTGASGKFDGSFDVMERQAGTGKLSAELNYGEDGFSVSGNADLGNGLGFGLESGRNGTTGSLTILGSQQGTVDEDGNYEANGNFLGEISGQDIIDLNEARQAQRDAAENERNPVKSAKDAKNAKDAADAKEARDDDAKEVGGEEGPSGLVDLAFAGLGVVMSAGAAFLAGGGSGSASPSSPAGGQSGAGNGGNANTSQATFAGRKEDEKDGKVKRDGDTKDEPPKKQPTKEELANFKDNIFWNTTRAATDAYLDKLDKQGVDTKEMRAHAEAQRANGVRDLTAGEIKVKRLNKELNDLKIELDKASDVASFGGASRLDVGPSLIQQLDSYRKDIQDKIDAKTKELGLLKNAESTKSHPVKLKNQPGVLDNEGHAKRVQEEKVKKTKELNDSMKGLPEANKKKLLEALKNGKNPDDLIKEAKSLNGPLNGLSDELLKRIKGAERNGSDIDYLDENGKLVFKIEAPLEDAPVTPGDFWGIAKAFKKLAKGGFKLGMAWPFRKDSIGVDYHHLLPQTFKDYFQRAGLDIEQFKIPLSKVQHTTKPGVHTNEGGNWNQVWRDFIEANPYASRDEILDQLNRMRDNFGI